MVNRKTLTVNTETTFSFSNKGEARYTIKNFTSDYILVAFDEYVEAEAYKIPAMTAQSIKKYSNTIIVKASSNGEVEIDG